VDGRNAGVVGLGTLFVAMGGFLFLIRQVKQIERTISSAANVSLSAQSIEILKEMARSPGSYACIYENAPLPDNDKQCSEILCVCERVADYLDHVASQQANLGPASQRWGRFVDDTLARSQVLRDYFRKYRNWYSPEPMARVEAVHPDKT
jgi:hypothetical protein